VVEAAVVAALMLEAAQVLVVIEQIQVFLYQLLLVLIQSQ
tara:strand:- start:398 stop:517 length:120 start_codon:yes stop_codon:yes gene_type:complete